MTATTAARAIAEGLCPRHPEPEVVMSIAMALDRAGDSDTLRHRMEKAKVLYRAMPLWRELYE
jgi:hypothetical protein